MKRFIFLKSDMDRCLPVDVVPYVVRNSQASQQVFGKGGSYTPYIGSEYFLLSHLLACPLHVLLLHTLQNKMTYVICSVCFNSGIPCKYICSMYR